MSLQNCLCIQQPTPSLLHAMTMALRGKAGREVKSLFTVCIAVSRHNPCTQSRLLPKQPLHTRIV